MQRPKGPTRPPKGTFECADSDWMEPWPLICAGLCDPFWDDGKVREPWTLKIAMDSERVMLTINDKESKLVSFTNAASFKEAMDKVESALASGTLSWRKSKY